MKHTLAACVAAATAGFTLLAAGGAANAAPDPTQRKINNVLAAHPGGVQTGKNTVAWEKGAVVLRLSTSAAAAAPCEDGRFCLYEHDHFGGDSLSFRDRLCDNRIINLTGFAFNDRVSSWANNTDHDIDVWQDIGGVGARLWQMLPYTESAGLSKSINDEASSLNCLR